MDLILGQVCPDDKEVILAKIKLETRRLDLDHAYRMEVLKMDVDVMVADNPPMKRRRVSVSDPNIGAEADADKGILTETMEEEQESKDTDKGLFEAKVHLFIQSLCEFGVDGRATRTVDRFRIDRVFLHEEFARLYGKTPQARFHAACRKLAGVKTVAIRIEGRTINALTGIRLKNRANLISEEDVIQQYLEDEAVRQFRDLRNEFGG
jgi:hypothetical protein